MSPGITRHEYKLFIIFGGERRFFEARTFPLPLERKEEKVEKDLKAFEYYEYTSILSVPVPVSLRSCSGSNLSPNCIFKKHL